MIFLEEQLAKNNYVKEVRQMIDKGIQDEVYAETEDNTFTRLKVFSGFLV